KETIASPLVVVRLDPSAIHLPPGRHGWAPQGILAYSKICTHAGCAIALYRKPTFPAVEPGPALVCPCHYSTFNPANGASVLYGFIILVATGIYLALFFDPSTAHTVYHGPYTPLDGREMSGAYRSVLDISLYYKAGLLIRQTHHWAADVFVVAIVLHLARVFF